MARFPGYIFHLRSSAPSALAGAVVCALIVFGRVAASPMQPDPLVSDAALGEVRASAAKSISVAIVLDKRIVGLKTFGDADAATAFSVGSVSKMFTAVSVWQLIQNGRIGLDADVTTYLRQYPALRGITVRQLLDHTNGLPNYLDDAFANGSVTRKTTADEIISSMLSKPRDFASGADWNYTNTGYVVLGRIVESVSGLPLAQYESEHIFKAVGMDRTFVAPSQVKDVAAPFDGEPGDWSWYYACGDVFSTAEDLARFDIALMQGRLLETKTFAAMQRTVPFATLAPGVRDGLGLFVTMVGDVSEVGHHGGEPGYRADNEMVPARGFAIAVVGSGNYNSAPIVSQALHAYVGANLQAPLPPDAYVDGAPAVTKRLTMLLADVGAGRDDRSQMQVLAAIGIPAIADQMRANGSLKGITFLSKFYTSAGLLYRYRLSFTKGQAVLTALIDESDKIATIEMASLPPPAK